MFGPDASTENLRLEAKRAEISAIFVWKWADLGKNE